MLVKGAKGVTFLLCFSLGLLGNGCCCFPNTWQLSKYFSTKWRVAYELQHCTILWNMLSLAWTTIIVHVYIPLYGYPIYPHHIAYNRVKTMIQIGQDLKPKGHPIPPIPELPNRLEKFQNDSVNEMDATTYINNLHKQKWYATPFQWCIESNHLTSWRTNLVSDMNSSRDFHPVRFYDGTEMCTMNTCIRIFIHKNIIHHVLEPN